MNDAKASALPVALIDDSAICRQQLRAILEADGDIRVVAEADSGRDVVEWLDRVEPAVLLTDLVMPGVGGLDVVREVMRARPLPVLVVSAGGFSTSSAFDATRLGALEVAKKPDFADHVAERALRSAVRRIAQVPVVRHPGAPVDTAPVTVQGPRGAVPSGPRPRVLGIGASAGGPPAVAALLGSLVATRAPAVLVAQHMPKDHADDFAAFLARRCALPVEVCRGASRLAPGKVIVPGDGMDLVMLGPATIGVSRSQSLLTPSVDALLHSVARFAGAAGAGAVLSGIGRDGADGLMALRAKGAWTMSQDEASCAVFGMPKAAAASARWHLSPTDMAVLLCGEAPVDASPKQP